LYNLNLSKHGGEETIEWFERNNKPLPSWATDEPENSRGDNFWMQAFFRLHSDRSVGMGAVGPIPWTAIHAYGSMIGLDRGMIEVFTVVIQRLDSRFLEWSEQQRKNAN